MSIYQAARMYNVPESPVRDHTRGKVEVDARNGTQWGGDNVDIRWRTEAGWAYQVYGIGYGYSKSGIQNMAKDYAESLEKDVK